MKDKLKKVLISVSVLFFWILIWELVSLAIGRELVFASPAAVASCLAELLVTVEFWSVCAMSLWRIICGFSIGVVFGVLCGVLSSFRIFDALLSPLMTVIRCVPVASFIILTWYFLSRDQVPVFTSFLMVTPIIWGNVKQGIESVDPALSEVTVLYRFSLVKKIRHLYIPAAFSYFMTGCTASLGLAWKAGIAAEVLCRPNTSIGNEIFLSKSYLETPALFAWTAVVVLLSLLLEKMLRFAVRKANIVK